MEGSVWFWIIILIVIIAVGLLMFALGTRARVDTGGYCEVDVHWYFGWWVRCVGGERCPPGEVCVLLHRRKGSEDEWADAGVIPGGSVKWSNNMEYRCVCRTPRA